MGIRLIRAQSATFEYPNLPLDGSKKLMEFLLDDTTDVNDLPTGNYVEDDKGYGEPAEGSHATVITTKDEYYRASAGDWTLFGPEPETP